MWKLCFWNICPCTTFLTFLNIFDAGACASLCHLCDFWKLQKLFLVLVKFHLIPCARLSASKENSSKDTFPFSYNMDRIHATLSWVKVQLQKQIMARIQHARWQYFFVWTWFKIQQTLCHYVLLFSLEGVL